MDHASDIGISTSAYTELMLPAALERIAELAPAAEIRSFGLHTLLSRRNRLAAQAAGLTYTVHGPFGYTGIWDLDEDERLKALDEHRRHLEASAAIGARLYVTHPDWRPGLAGRDAAVVAALERSFERLLPWQDEYGVEVVVENMPGAGRSHFAHPGDLDLRGLGLVLDVGHANISGCLDEWLSEPQAPLRHLHVHDNNGEGDDDDPHLGLGAGVIDAAAVMAAARAAGASVVLENDREDDLLASLAHLRELGLL
ncbi:MAG: sugar phosphate isomerase/epimerase [Thermoleophilia bacterium]|nr:sugar phosphate isomerase/epimerase [Thermoleophilia bacterium]